MKWMFHIPDDGLGFSGRQLTITADNWFAALHDGLNRCSGSVVASISCNPTSDGSVEVRDAVSGRVFYLHPFSDVEKQDGPSAAIEIFGTRHNEADEGGITYREQLVRVPDWMTVTESRDVARDVLLAQVKPIDDEQLVVAVYVYNHKFEEHPLKPPLLRMSWEQWNPNRIIVDYPVHGEEDGDFESVGGSLRVGDDAAVSAAVLDVGQLDITRSSADSRCSASVSFTGYAEQEFESATPCDSKSEKGEIEVTSLNGSLASERPVDNVCSGNSRDGERKVPDAVAGVDGGVMWAFEQLQRLYGTKQHDEAAQVILDTLMEGIPTEACAVMLNTPGRDELYIAAHRGFADVEPDTIRVPAMGGIVGATLRLGAVMRVEDPLDERFNARVDLRGTFEIGNVLVSPVAFEGHTFGVIQMFNREVNASFSDEDANIISYVAGAFAEFINHSLPCREAEFLDREFKRAPDHPKSGRESAGTAKKKEKRAAEVKNTSKAAGQAGKQKQSDGKSSDRAAVRKKKDAVAELKARENTERTVAQKKSEGKAAQGGDTETSSLKKRKNVGATDAAYSKKPNEDAAEKQKSDSRDNKASSRKAKKNKKRQKRQ
ncbi:MAG: GAF domain-containing protein [Deltaproteobacteria bacterium]|nr:GAF domain-containing protein [Deltaproteobacteria bacterium]